jgi:hypothetical protein
MVHEMFNRRLGVVIIKMFGQIRLNLAFEKQLGAAPGKSFEIMCEMGVITEIAGVYDI